MPAGSLSDEERQARREADRQRTREAVEVEALRASVGWQQWLRLLRHHFHSYCLLISRGGVADCT